MTAQVPGGELAVLVDTMIATWTWFTGPRKSEASRKHLALFGEQLVGKTLVISGQTRAELIGLKLSRGLTSEQQEELQELLDAIPYLPLDKSVQHRYAELGKWGRACNHPISQKPHAADRWIAATAVEFNLPIASSDKIFSTIPQVLCLAPLRRHLDSPADTEPVPQAGVHPSF